MFRNLKIVALVLLCCSVLTSCDTAKEVQMQAGTFVENPIELEMKEVLTSNGIYKERDKFGMLYPYSYYETEDTMREAYIDIYNSLYEMSFVCDIKEYRLKSWEVYSLIHNLLIDNPDFYYVDTNVQMHTVDDYVETLSFKYKYTEQQVEIWKSTLKEVADKVKTAMPTDLSNYEKYLYIHDYITDNAKYSEDNVHSKDMLGVLLSNMGVCQGYTGAYSYLCRALNLPYAVGTAQGTEPHIWNMIYCDDVWLNVDVTADDDYIASHKYFGVSKATLYTTGLTEYSEEDIHYVKSPNSLDNDSKSYYALYCGDRTYGRDIRNTTAIEDIITYCVESSASDKPLEIVTNAFANDYIRINVFEAQREELTRALGCEMMIKYDENKEFILVKFIKNAN